VEATVSWRLTIPGQPLSWNQSYRIGVRNRRGYNRAEGQFRTIIKTDEAVAYTDMVTMLAMVARPSGWKVERGQFVVLEFYYYLGRAIDADNVMKLVNDGIKAAIGVDDKWFLPRAMSMQLGLPPSEQRLELVIEVCESASPPQVPWK
jgi:hypothetical protein